MSTHINLSTAISELKEMFPSFDEDVIHMVRAISSLLIMSGDDNPELVKQWD